MPRKVPIKATPEQNKEAYRKVKEHRQEAKARRAAARVAEAFAGSRQGPSRRVGPGGPGRPFGTTGGYFKPWMKRILGNFYTDTDLVRDFILLSPKERIQFIQDLDPKTIGEGSPEEIAARIKAALEAIQNSVPKPK
jgi:hypothetical protein